MAFKIIVLWCVVNYTENLGWTGFVLFSHRLFLIKLLYFTCFKTCLRFLNAFNIISNYAASINMNVKK